MSHTTTARFSPYPTIPLPVIEAAQQAHLISEPWTKLIEEIPKNVWQTPRTPPFNGLLDTAQRIALYHAETVAALQEIPHRAINQTLAAQSAAMADLVQRVRASISASGIEAALAATDTLRNIPIARMQHLFSIWQPSYVPRPFVEYGLSLGTSSSLRDEYLAKKKNSSHCRTRLREKFAKKEYLRMSAAALVLIQTTSPEILDSIREFARTPACSNLLSLLSASAYVANEYLSPSDRKTLAWIIWVLTVLIILSK